MNEIINLISTLQQLPLFYIGIGVLFILLLLTKNNFSQPPTLPHKSHASLLAIFTFLFAIIPAGYFGWSYYQLYFPDFNYEEVSATVDFHIYQPQYLPPKIQQKTAFHQTDKAVFTTSPTIRATDNRNLSQLVRDDGIQVIVIDQSKTVDPFSMIYFNELLTEKINPSASVSQHNLTSFPNSPAFSISNSSVSMLWLRTRDNVLIMLTSPSSNTALEELIKIAESLH